MSQENVEIVRRAGEHWTSRDLSRMSEVFDPEVVVDLSRNVFNPAVYRGYEGVRRWVEAVDEMWDEFEAKIEELIDAGDQVFSAARIKGKGRGSGVEVSMRTFGVFTLRNGRLVRYVGGYRDRAEALKAAGLSE
jgi:ketosteroid isomerase-like protein